MKRLSIKSGFTLVELAITTGTFLLLVSVVLARYRSFGINTDFNNAVENVVLSLREAQVYGAGGKTAGGVMCGTPPSSFSCAYGVHFQSLGTSYIVFVDTDGNGVYDSGTDGLVQTVTLPSGVSILEINIGGTLESPLSVVFKRPFPDALINNGLSNASISLTKNGDSSSVTITPAGQISTQ